LVSGIFCSVSATTSSAAPDPVPPGNVPTVDVVGGLDGRGSRLVYILRS
jgi:hypothetical protein